MLKKIVIQIGTFCFILSLTLSTAHSPISKGYVEEKWGQAEEVVKEEDPLYMEILSHKKELDIAPMDAKVDSVWKAIPGLNGQTIDVQASYEKLKKYDTFDESELIFHETTPSVSLADLPAQPIYRGNPEKQMAGVMVNVAWGNEYLPKLLKILSENNVQATFFLDGSWVKNNSHLAMMIKEEGHEIGNHAYSHPNMKQLSSGRINDEISRTNEVIEATLNVTPTWFAPPSGSYRQEVVEIARDYDLYTVLWTVDTIDWKNPDPKAMADRVVNETEAGLLILMHPTESAEKGLELILQGVKEKGLALGKLSEVLGEKRAP
ncbi:polysaccharide deacetylase family protein [Salipaludibacillus sp. CF4.18]|uniref:polysaccharide deacetylase family protein n=1 Tax=Salipaludibacillus sp. CF4.18 TaxID=3373081 RepID=UPI003EE6E784